MEIPTQKKEMTNLQQKFVAESVCLDDKGKIIFASKDPNVKYQNLFHVLVNEKSKTFKVPKEMFHKDMRKWITQLLIQSPYGKIFTNSQGDIEQELLTYNEMCTLKPEDMEWGVVQKLISMLVIADVSFFPIDVELEKAYTCLHTDKGADMIRLQTCERCHGLGYMEGTQKPTKEEIILRNYNTMMNQAKKIQIFILDEIIKIKEWCAEEIWWNRMTHTERFNANGEIAKANPKTMKQQNNIVLTSS